MRQKRPNERDIRKLQADLNVGDPPIVWVDTLVSALQVHIYRTTCTYRFVKQINGIRHNKKIGDTNSVKLTDARTFAQKLEIEIKSELYHPQSDMLIKMACRQFLIPYYTNFVKDTKHPIAIIHRYLIAYFGEYPINKLTAAIVQQSIYSLIEAGYSPETIRKYILVGKKLYKELIKHRLYHFSPFEGLDRPKVSNIITTVLTQQQRHPFIECCLEEDSVFGDYILLLLLTGLRSSECARIKLSDISDDFQFLNLPTTKSGVHQQIVLNSFAQEVLKRRSELTWNDYLFPSPIKTNTHISSPRGALDRIKENMAARGFDISEITLHTLRKTFASTCAEVTSGDLNMVAQQIRHSSIHVLKRYVHRQRNDVIAASEATAQSLMTPVKYIKKQQGSSNA